MCTSEKTKIVWLDEQQSNYKLFRIDTSRTEHTEKLKFGRWKNILWKHLGKWKMCNSTSFTR